MAVQLTVYVPEADVLRLPELYTGVFVVSATTPVYPPSVYVPHWVNDWLPPFKLKLAVAPLVLYTCTVLETVPTFRALSVTE